MVSVNDLKNGITIEFNDNIFQVLYFQHVKPGKGPAFVRTKLKNLRTGAIIDHTFNAGIKVGKAHIEKKKTQYLYNAGDTYYFMDNNTFEQIELNQSKLETESKFLIDELLVDLIYYKGELLGIVLPDKVELKVTRAEPAVKGDTATNTLKEVELETGMNVYVPLFIKEGETIIINTDDGKYVGRKK